MMNIPMNSANRLEMLDHHRVGGQHRLELLPAAGRRLDLKPGAQQRRQLALALGNRACPA